MRTQQHQAVVASYVAETPQLSRPPDQLTHSVPQQRGRFFKVMLVGLSAVTIKLSRYRNDMDLKNMDQIDVANGAYSSF